MPPLFHISFLVITPQESPLKFYNWSSACQPLSDVLTSSGDQEDQNSTGASSSSAAAFEFLGAAISQYAVLFGVARREGRRAFTIPVRRGRGKGGRAGRGRREEEGGK